jgi:hypothetical protein
MKKTSTFVLGLLLSEIIGSENIVKSIKIEE